MMSSTFSYSYRLFIHPSLQSIFSSLLTFWPFINGFIILILFSSRSHLYIMSSTYFANIFLQSVAHIIFSLECFYRAKVFILMKSILWIFVVVVSAFWRCFFSSKVVMTLFYFFLLEVSYYQVYDLYQITFCVWFEVHFFHMQKQLFHHLHLLKILFPIQIFCCLFFNQSYNCWSFSELHFVLLHFYANTTPFLFQ